MNPVGRPGIELTTREADVPNALSEIDYQLERLENAVRQVVERITPVVRQEPGEDRPKAPPYSSGNCILSQQLRARRERAANIADALETVYQQIEL